MERMYISFNNSAGFCSYGMTYEQKPPFSRPKIPSITTFRPDQFVCEEATFGKLSLLIALNRKAPREDRSRVIRFLMGTKRSAPAVRDDVLDWVGPPKSKQTKHTHTNRNVTKGFMTWFAFAVAKGILTNGPYNHIVIILILLNTRRAPATRLGSISVHAASLAYRANTNIIRAFVASRSYLRARDGAHLAP